MGHLAVVELIHVTTEVDTLSLVQVIIITGVLTEGYGGYKQPVLQGPVAKKKKQGDLQKSPTVRDCL